MIIKVMQSSSGQHECKCPSTGGPVRHRINKLFRIHPLGIMNVSTNFHFIIFHNISKTFEDLVVLEDEARGSPK